MLAHLVVFTPHITPRIQYTFESLLPALTGCAVRLTTNEEETYQIAYHHFAKSGSIQVVPCGLLHDEALKADILPDGDRILVNGIPDVAAFIFWMAARLEEYETFSADAHGRFPASAAWAFQQQMHLKPLAEIAAHQLISQAGTEILGKQVAKVMTVDIDQPLLFHQGTLYHLFKCLKRLAHGQTDYINYLMNGKDPWNIYQQLSKQFNSAELYIFCLLADYGGLDRGSVDVNLWKRIAFEAGPTVWFGLHPSYASNSSQTLWERERNAYQDIFGTTPVRSRQHFLKLSLPETYRTLVNKGIREDYTMGWADQVGFRSGISVPYPWFDALLNKELPLTVVPFCAMDVTMKNYMKLNPKEAAEVLKYIFLQIPAGGRFITLWHNESLSGFGEWKNWDQLAQDIYKL